MKTLLIVLSVCCHLQTQAQPKLDTLSILFIGNSYTYFNNLPVVVKSIAAHNGQPINAEMIVAGGMTLKGHWHDSTHVALKKLQSRHWDFVIMQDQSQLGLEGAGPEPIDKHWIAKPDTFYRYAQLWSEEIKKQQATPCFATTWAREYDPSAQPLLTHAYTTISRQTRALLIPVGDVWQYCLTTYKQIKLYQSDGSHPTQAGSFLMATTVLQSLLPTLKLRVGYPVIGLPVDIRGKVLNTSIHINGSQNYTIYPSTNEVVLIGLAKKEQEILLTVSQQTERIRRSLISHDNKLPNGLLYH
ncbi:hypothetical protein [Spirosoma flavum]|uniref:SGNH/GDSL hydrolase family protein n=1 Tax=Spirosoma flavum TaxID=2048557 RepID=A0ABW6AMV9_9BACT